jgi:hypothetical protein
MARRDAQNDRRINDLITEAQRVSNPLDRIPAPPSHYGIAVGSIFGDGLPEIGELDRSEPPPWFEPNSNEGLDASDDEGPPIPDECEVPTPSPQDAAAPGRIGTEALAYYAPFHFYGPGRWGIYIRDWGLTYLACVYKGNSHLAPADTWILRGAYRFLLEHERFHFRTEVAATRLHFMTGSPNLYNAHFHDRYASWLEEGMANASAYRELMGGPFSPISPMLKDFVDFLGSWMQTQPSGYRHYEQWSRSDYYYARGMRATTARLLELDVTHQPMLRHADPYTLDLNKRSSSYSFLPVRRVHDSGCAILSSFKPFPKANGMQAFVYTRDHPPPHVHVEFIGSGRMIKVRWPDLGLLDKNLRISNAEHQAVRNYLAANEDEIRAKLQRVYPEENVAAL